MLKKTVFCLLLVSGSLRPALAQTAHTIDPDRSVVTVKVYKAGLLSGFGHNHDIQGPVRQGTVDEEKGTVELVIDARQLKVMDQELSDKDRNDVQQNMVGPKVLDVEHFPEIRFRSTSTRPAGENKWTVQGELEIHGQTRPVTVEVTRYAGLASQAARYRGAVELRQRDFGIRPYSGVGGTIKVKDEIRVEYDVAVHSTPGAGTSHKGRN
jgi:polyisoprenoid-binding protein YceI